MSNKLEDAAFEYRQNLSDKLAETSKDFARRVLIITYSEKAFVHGADWQAEQDRLFIFWIGEQGYQFNIPAKKWVKDGHYASYTFEQLFNDYKNR